MQTDIEKLIERLKQRADTMNGTLVGASDGYTYAVGYYGPIDRQLDRALLDKLSRMREAERRAKEATRPFLEVDIALSRAHLQGHLGAGDLVLASVEAVRVASDLYRSLSTQVEERE
jgi:hypothetical protein